MRFINSKLIGSQVDAAEYHGQKIPRGMQAYPMSPSALKLFGHCPNRWLHGYQPPESEAKDWGSLLDCLVLTPELFSARYVVPPLTYTETRMKCPKCESLTDSKKCAKCKCDRIESEVSLLWSPQALKCQEWKNRQIEQGLEVISQQDLDDAKAARERLLSDDVIKAFLDASDKQVLVEAQWQDDETGLTIPVRCLMDLVPRADTEFAKCLGDLKSSFTAALTPFARNVHKLGYHVQAAFDLDMFVAATGEDRNTWCFIIQESFPPWQSGKRILSQDFLELGRTEYKRLMRLYCQCLKTGFWPGYDDHDEAVQSWSLVAPEPWMGSEALFSPRFHRPDMETETHAEYGDLIP